MGRNRRSLIALLGVVAIVGSLLVVVPAMGQTAPSIYDTQVDLVLDEAGYRFTMPSGEFPDQGISTERGCQLSQSSETLIDLQPNGRNLPLPGLASDSIGIKSSGSNSNGTPCSQIDGPEPSLGIQLGSQLAAQYELSGLTLDLEMTGDAVVKLTLDNPPSGQSATYYLETGTSITVCDPDQTDPNQSDFCDDEADGEDYYEVSSGPGDITAACAAPNSSGPNSGGSDNCVWNVDPGFTFSRIQLDVVDIGTVSLEGGSDTGVYSTFYLQEQKGSISGQKWRDHDNDGQRDPDFEEGMNGWLMKAYRSDGGTLVEVGFDTTATETIGGDLVDGYFTISGLPYGTYTVCEFPPVVTGVPDYFTWYQSTPGDSAGACSSIEGAEPDGWVVTVDGDETGADFFNVRTLTLIDDPATVDIDCDNLPIDPETGLAYIETIESGQPLGRVEIDPENCKPGEYVFETYVLNVGGQFEQVADFYPLFETTETMPIVEDYTWLPLSNAQLILRYDDTDPFDDLQPMLFCALPEELLDGYSGPLTDFLPTGETSCLFETFEEIVNNGTVEAPIWSVVRTDRVFTLIDGRRTLR